MTETVKNKAWYCMRVRTNFEKKVLSSLDNHLEHKGYKDLVEEVFVPIERVIVNKTGQKQQVKDKHLFPGYMFIKCEMTDNLFIMLKNDVQYILEVTTDVNNKPVPISPLEIQKMKKMAQLSEDKPKHHAPFSKDDVVIIKSGSFKDFSGAVDSINYDNKMAKVMVSVFNRNVPIDIKFSELEKA